MAGAGLSVAVAVLTCLALALSTHGEQEIKDLGYVVFIKCSMTDGEETAVKDYISKSVKSQIADLAPGDKAYLSVVFYLADGTNSVAHDHTILNVANPSDVEATIQSTEIPVPSSCGQADLASACEAFKDIIMGPLKHPTNTEGFTFMGPFENTGSPSRYEACMAELQANNTNIAAVCVESNLDFSGATNTGTNTPMNNALTAVASNTENVLTSPSLDLLPSRATSADFYNWIADHTIVKKCVFEIGDCNKSCGIGVMNVQATCTVYINGQQVDSYSYPFFAFCCKDPCTGGGGHPPIIPCRFFPSGGGTTL